MNFQTEKESARSFRDDVAERLEKERCEEPTKRHHNHEE